MTRSDCDSTINASAESKAWTFLNSSFVLFVLSSLVLGSASFLYGGWRDEKVRHKSIEKLDLELALRLNEMENLSTGRDKDKYHTIVNISNIISGSTKVSFYVRTPIFNDFENKNTSTLLWQLYLLVPAKEQGMIRATIQLANQVSAGLRDVRLKAVDAPPDRNEEAYQKLSKAQQEKLDSAEDRLEKEFGQAVVFDNIHQLASLRRWRSVIESGPK